MKLPILFLLSVLLTLALTACGKSGDPQPLEPGPYKRTYPKPT